VDVDVIMNNINANVNVTKTTVCSIEAIVCELQRAREREVTELLSAREREVLDNFSELPICVSQNGEMGDMHEKPEKMDVMTDINPEGKYDDEELVEKQV
jgi:hypothetical protein